MKISIVETHPKIAAQWHLTKNGDLKPEDFTYGSNKKVWWKCFVAPDHEWQATIKNRVHGYDCPCCVGQKAVKSNCLSTTHPEIAAQWHPIKNGNKKPDNYMSGSHKKVWWQCFLGSNHEWQATIKSRKEGNCCPHCSESRGEKEIKKFLENNGLKFKRQYKFRNCVRARALPFDFLVQYKGIKLIEYQGKQHYIPVSFGSNKSSKFDMFALISESDKIKKNWCRENKIPLLEVPYWDFDRIPELLKKFLEINT